MILFFLEKKFFDAISILLIQRICIYLTLVHYIDHLYDFHLVSGGILLHEMLVMAFITIYNKEIIAGSLQEDNVNSSLTDC